MKSTVALNPNDPVRVYIYDHCRRQTTRDGVTPVSRPPRLSSRPPGTPLRTRHTHSPGSRHAAARPPSDKTAVRCGRPPLPFGPHRHRRRRWRRVGSTIAAVEQLRGYIITHAHTHTHSHVCLCRLQVNSYKCACVYDCDCRTSVER